MSDCTQHIHSPPLFHAFHLRPTATHQHETYEISTVFCLFCFVFPSQPVLNDTFISMQLFCDAFLLLRPLAPIHFLMNRLVRSVGIFGPFELHFESLHANLEAIHGLNSSLSTGRVVETHKTKAFALIGSPIDKDFGTDDIAER